MWPPSREDSPSGAGGSRFPRRFAVASDSVCCVPCVDRWRAPWGYATRRPLASIAVNCVALRPLREFPMGSSRGPTRLAEYRKRPQTTNLGPMGVSSFVRAPSIIIIIDVILIALVLIITVIEENTCRHWFGNGLLMQLYHGPWQCSDCCVPGLVRYCVGTDRSYTALILCWYCPGREPDVYSIGTVLVLH